MAIPVEVVLSSAVPNERPTIQVHQDTGATCLVTLTDREGVAYDLDADTYVVTFEAREYMGADLAYISKTCTFSDGKAQLTLVATDLPYAGVFVGEFTIKGTDEVAIDRARCFLGVEKAIDASNTFRPLSISDVRMAIRDRHANDNTLLGMVEFSSTEIARAILKPVSYWNESRPILTNKSYTPSTFPYSYHWEEAVIAELYLMAARQLQRNRVIVNTGGVQTDTSARADYYSQEGTRMQQEYKIWVLEAKMAANYATFFGTSSSPHF